MSKKRRPALGASVFVRADGRVSVKALGMLSALAAVAAVGVLTLAGIGSAASVNICNVTTPGAASCVVENSSPHFTSAANATDPNNAPFVVTKFINESGTSGATATHVVVTQTFGSAVNVLTESLAINGVAADAATLCTPAAPANNVTTVSCAVGNISGGGLVKLTIRYTTATPVGSSLTLTGGVSYGESKTSGNPSNAVQSHTDALNVTSNTGATAGGGCFSLGTAQTAIVAGANGNQSTQVTLGQGAGQGSADLPCTFADAGVEPNNLADPSAKLKTDISFFEFPTFANNGLAVVKILLASLPTGVKLNQAVIKEDTNYASPFFKTYITVPACNKDGTIPAPVGVPAQGSTDAMPHSNDLCIFNRSPQPGGGAEFDLHSFGSPPDGHVGV